MDISLTSEIMLILRFAFIVIGLIGNVISFIVFSRPVFKKNSISTYYRALAIFDCFTINELIATAYLLFFGEFLPQNSDTACKTYFYLGMAFTSVSGWILIAFSIDKILNMKKIATNIINKKSSQYAGIFLIVLSNMLLYIGVPIYLKVVTIYFYGIPIPICDLTNLSFGPFISAVFMIQGSVLPFLIMITTSIISIKMIRDSTRNIERNTSNTNFSSTRNNRDFKFAISSVAFNISFIVLKLPLTLLVVLDAFLPAYSSDFDALSITCTVYYIHYSGSFFIHLASNSIFRREFLTIWRLYLSIGTDFWQRCSTALVKSSVIVNRRSNIVSVTNKIDSS